MGAIATTFEYPKTTTTTTTTPAPTTTTTTTTTQAPTPDGYIHHTHACVHGHNIERRSDQSVAACAAWCDSVAECYGFEYGVDYGEKTYKAGDCQLQSKYTSLTEPCTGYNLDMYVKAPT